VLAATIAVRLLIPVFFSAVAATMSRELFLPAVLSAGSAPRG